LLKTAEESAPRADALASEIAEAEKWSGKKILLMEELDKRNKLISQETDTQARLTRIEKELAETSSEKLQARMMKESSDLKTRLDDIAQAKSELLSISAIWSCWIIHGNIVLSFADCKNGQIQPQG
jgi:hypothetical protein